MAFLAKFKSWEIETKLQKKSTCFCFAPRVWVLLAVYILPSYHHPNIPLRLIETGAELVGSFGAIGFSSYLCVSFSLYFGQVGLLNSHLLLRCWLPMTYARDAKEKIIKQETFFILEFDRSEENWQIQTGPLPSGEKLLLTPRYVASLWVR